MNCVHGSTCVCLGNVSFMSFKLWLNGSILADVYYEAILTTPKKDSEKLPLVVIPHGGPHGLRIYIDLQSKF